MTRAETGELEVLGVHRVWIKLCFTVPQFLYTCSRKHTNTTCYFVIKSQPKRVTIDWSTYEKIFTVKIVRAGHCSRYRYYGTSSGSIMKKFSEKIFCVFRPFALLFLPKENLKMANCFWWWPLLWSSLCPVFGTQLSLKILVRTWQHFLARWFSEYFQQDLPKVPKKEDLKDNPHKDLIYFKIMSTHPTMIKE